jgi:hypothetical protein
MEEHSTSCPARTVGPSGRCARRQRSPTSSVSPSRTSALMCRSPTAQRRRSDRRRGRCARGCGRRGAGAADRRDGRSLRPSRISRRRDLCHRSILPVVVGDLGAVRRCVIPLSMQVRLNNTGPGPGPKRAVNTFASESGGLCPSRGVGGLDRPGVGMGHRGHPSDRIGNRRWETSISAALPTSST